MKKVAVLFLVSILLFNAVGYELVFRVMRYRAVKEVKKGLKLSMARKDLKTIRIPSSLKNISCKRLQHINDHEFLLDGVMYDVVSQTEKNGSVEYLCITDKQETRLFAHLKDHVDKHISTSAPLKKKAGEVLKKLVKDYIPAEDTSPPALTFSSPELPNHSCAFSAAGSIVPTPPPRTC